MPAMPNRITPPPGLLEAILSASPDHYFVLDRDARYLYANAAAGHAFDRDPATLVGLTVDDLLLPPELAARLRQQLRIVFDTGRPTHGEARIPAPDGLTRRYEHVFVPLLAPDGNVASVLATVRDVTEMRQSQEHLHLAVEAAGLGTFTCDWPTGQITGNATFRAQMGLAPDVSFTFPDFRALLHPDDRDATLAAIERTTETHQEFNSEYRIVLAHGDLRWINAIGRAHFDDRGQMATLDGITLDITHRKTIEGERDAARHDAELRAQELTVVYEKEHRIAEALQRTLLSRPPAHALAGLEVETVYAPALNEAQVGGDFYDVLALENGRMALIVGDVSGKGLAAASRTAEIRYTLRAYLSEYPYAAVTLERLNVFLCQAQAFANYADTYFVCLTLAILDPMTGVLEISSAGAEAPFLLRATGETEEILAGGMPLGITPKAEYAAATRTLLPGDVLTIATDGLTEARHGHQFLGIDGLARLARKSLAAPSLLQMGQAVLVGAQTYAGGALHDDACLLLARRA